MCDDLTDAERNAIQALTRPDKHMVYAPRERLAERTGPMTTLMGLVVKGRMDMAVRGPGVTFTLRPN